MEMLITLVGLVGGILIGLTGTGGGVLVTPLLLIFTPYPAVVIIGTDILSGAVTKLVGVLEHRRLGQVHWGLAKFLIVGSVPGTVAGIVLIRLLKTHLTVTELDHVLKMILGATLFGVSFLLPLVRGTRGRLLGRGIEPGSARPRVKLLVVGASVGFLVAMTSIGSGSLLMIFLLFLVPMSFAHLVGTDILFGLVTMALAGSLHLALGHFSAGLFLRLAAGAIPGVIIGSRLTRIIPDRYFSWLFSILYFSLGARLLVG